jgi:transposase
MRSEITDSEWEIIRLVLTDKPHGIAGCERARIHENSRNQTMAGCL